MCKTVKKIENSSRLYHLSHHFWSCHSAGYHPRHCWECSQCWEFHHVEFCDHDEEEDEVGVQKCVCRFQILWKSTIQCVVLSCPHRHRNMKHTFALFLLKAHQRTCWCFVSFSFPQWFCLVIGIVTSHEDHVFLTISLALRHVMLDVNSGEVVEVLDASLSPPDRHLRSSEYLVVLPSAQYWGMVDGFCMVFLPLIVSVPLSSWTKICTTMWRYQSFKSGFDAVHRVLIRSEPNAT